MEQWGAPAEIIAAQERPENEAAAGAFEVWPENWDIVVAFLAVATQWRVAPLSTMERARLHFLGLDYTAVRARLGWRPPDARWDGLQTMELAARDVMNE